MIILPFVLLILPLAILSLAIFLYLTFYIDKYKSLSQKKFLIAYWSVQAVLEMLFLFVFVDGVQFIPPSIFISYVYGTLFFIFYSIQCLLTNNPLSIKLKFIGSSAVLNYFIIPLSLIFVP